MSGMHWNVGLQPWPGLLLVPHHCCLWTTDGADSLAWIWPGAWDKQELSKHLEWRFEAVNLQGTTWTSSFVKRCWGLLLYFLAVFWFLPWRTNVLLWLDVALHYLLAVARSARVGCHVLSLLPWVLSYSKFAGLHIRCMYIYIYIYSTQRAYYTCYIHVLRWFQYLTSIEQDSYWLLFLLYIVSCITFDAFSIIEVFQCILMPQECIHCILLLRARVDKWALQFFFIDLGLHSCGFLMKCIVQMAYVFLSVKDCEGIWVMPARFVIAQTSGALFADAVLCWRECHGTHGRSIHFSGRELNVPVPSWDQIGPNCIMRIRLL